MTASADGPLPEDPGRPCPEDHPDDPAPIPPWTDAVDRQLQARNSEQVFQAGGDQYIIQQVTRPAAVVTVTNTLTRDTAAFTGREKELEALVTTVTRAVQARKMIPIHVIDGMAGVGKTTLAIRAAHVLAEHFPDGQLFVDLHAHSVDQGPVEPADALAALLSADGVHHRKMPAGSDERAALWRARMAGKRMLIILDNAAGSTQVQCLLPAAPGCLVLITSRQRLTALRANHAPEILTLETLPADQAVALCVKLAGRPLDGADRQAVAELVRLCGYLPLAISLLAVKLREPLWRVTELVDEISATQNRLAYMQAEHLAVESVFQLSYRDLPAARSRFFRRLGLHPGTEIDVYAAAALDGSTLVEARRDLDALYAAHLIDQPVWGRYRMHDLLREYARSLSAEDPAAEREQVVGRVLDYYQYTADAANGYLAPRPRPTSVTSPPRAVLALANADQAMHWMHAERVNLMACAAYAQRHSLADRLVRLAAALAVYLDRTGPWHQAIALHRQAAAAAQRLGDRPAQADALFAMSILLRQTGEYGGAEHGLHQALDMYADLGDQLRQADVLVEMGIVCRPAGEFRRAVEVLGSALALYHELDDSRGQAAALSNLAVVHWLTDDFPEATRVLAEALTIYQSIDDLSGRADALFYFGVVRRLTDDYPAARHALQEALTLYADLGDRLGEANARHNLAVVQRMTGGYQKAEQGFKEAIDIYVRLGDRLDQANALKQLGVVYRLTGDFPTGERLLREALAIYTDLGDRSGQANTLGSLGVLLRLTGDLDAAAKALDEALALYRKLNGRLGQAEVLNETAVLLLQRGDVSEALARHELARRLAVEVHSALEEARALEGISRCALRQHDPDGASVSLRQALEIYRRIGVPEAAQAAADLADIESNHPETSHFRD